MAITDKYGLFPDDQYQTHGLLRKSVQKFHFLSKGLSANKSSVENVACTVQLYLSKSLSTENTFLTMIFH